MTTSEGPSGQSKSGLVTQVGSAAAQAPIRNDAPRWKLWVKRGFLWGLFVLLIMGIGFVIAKLTPNFQFFPSFWWDFFTGPPAAGVFAVVAALIALNAAKTSANASLNSALQNIETTAHNARRQEWWNKAEWALNLATSDESSNRTVGINALVILFDDAEPHEAEFLKKVIANVSGGEYKSGAVETPKVVQKRGHRAIMKLKAVLSNEQRLAKRP